MTPAPPTRRVRPPLVLGSTVRVVSRLKAAAHLHGLRGTVVGAPVEVAGVACVAVRFAAGHVALVPEAWLEVVA